MAIPIKHVSIKVSDLAKARAFYEDMLGYKHVRTGNTSGLEGDYVVCHMTDGSVDLALEYFGEPAGSAASRDVEPCIDHFGMEVEDIDDFLKRVEAWGGKVLIRHSAARVKFKVPNLPVMEIVQAGRWTKPIQAIDMSDT